MSKHAANKGLLHAAKAKKDEFYTQLNDIEKELKYYSDKFESKVVFCNCDDPMESNFVKYFSMKFNSLGLKKLVATHYKGADLYTSEPPYKLEFSGFDPDDLFPKPENFVTEMIGDGDFRSKECVDLLEQSDVVVTNPPFSLFREFVSTLVRNDKSFLIIGSVNAISYRSVFQLIKENKVWLGPSIHGGDREFRVPDDYPLVASNSRIDSNGNKFIRVKGVRWFTNIDYQERHRDLILYKEYDPAQYPKYDNFDAIEVSKTKDIPIDYTGLIGVPITFLDKYNPKQFEIMGLMATTKVDQFNFGYPYVDGKKKFARIIIRHRLSQTNVD